MTIWTDACAADDIEAEDLIGVVIEGREIAVYRSPDDRFYATDGLCTHEEVPLSGGLVMGHVIECPKHNGRFDYRTGEGRSAPICDDLRVYPVQVVDGRVFVDLG